MQGGGGWGRGPPGSGRGHAGAASFSRQAPGHSGWCRAHSRVCRNRAGPARGAHALRLASSPAPAAPGLRPRAASCALLAPGRRRVCAARRLTEPPAESAYTPPSDPIGRSPPLWTSTQGFCRGCSLSLLWPSPQGRAWHPGRGSADKIRPSRLRRTLLDLPLNPWTAGVFLTSLASATTPL